MEDIKEKTADEYIDKLEEKLNEHHTNIFNNSFLIIYEKEIQAIENLLKRYKELEEEEMLDKADIEEIFRLRKKCVELEEENKRLIDEYMIQKHLINADFLKDYVPISVIQNKLIEAEHYVNNVDVTEGQAMYKVLQELLDLKE